MHTHPPRFYLPQLDGLRFVAFLLVFIHNANPILKGTFLEKFSEYSWFGVDLFFCLSGFLITKLLVTEHEQTGRINIRNFYIRRALRILPLYFFYIIVGSILIAPVEGRNVNLPWHIASLSTFTFNFAYFALLPSPILIFVHLWSISYEEQFYAVIPWLVRKLSTVAKSTVTSWMLAILIAGLFIRGIFINWNFPPTSIYFLPLTHFDSMLGGIALGLGMFDKLLDNLDSRLSWMLGIGLLALIFLLPNNDITSWWLMLTYLFVGIGSTCIIHSTVRDKNTVFSAVLKQRILAQLGKISYGLYVFHFGAFTISVWIYYSVFGIQKLTSHATVLILMIAFLITVVFSALSYKILEKPFLKLKAHFSMVASV